MKALIVISCILANGQHYNPSGHYFSWDHCNMWVENFEKRIFETKGGKMPLCWCHARPDLQRSAPPPKRRPAIRYSNDRKAPL